MDLQAIRAAEDAADVNVCTDCGAQVIDCEINLAACNDCGGALMLIERAADYFISVKQTWHTGWPAAAERVADELDYLGFYDDAPEELVRGSCSGEACFVFGNLMSGHGSEISGAALLEMIGLLGECWGEMVEVQTMGDCGCSYCIEGGSGEFRHYYPENGEMTLDVAAFLKGNAAKWLGADISCLAAPDKWAATVMLWSDPNDIRTRCGMASFGGFETRADLLEALIQLANAGNLRWTLKGGQ